MLKIIAIGNLGKDCFINEVNGRKVINFNVAHTEKYKDRQGNTVNNTTWMECAYWTDKTGIAQYLKKGTQVCIEGKPKARSYSTNDNKCAASLQVNVERIQLLGSANNNSNSGGDTSAATEQSTLDSPYNNNGGNNGVGPDDDLPF